MRLIKLLDMRYPKPESKQKKRYGLYECPKCNDNFETCVNNVKGGHVKCCANCGKDRHNMTKTKLYFVYRGMLNRCYNSNTKAYLDYGERGISVCEEWKNKASAFFEWAKASGYKEGLSIDRINNDGNYEPSNCRWADKSTQATNTKKLQRNNTTGFRGIYKDKNSFRAIIVAEGERVNIGSYETIEKAIVARDKYITDNKLKNIKNA